jgi:oligopeptide transport system permease protein
VVLLAVTFLFYALVFLIPGDPIRALFGFRTPPPELLSALRHEYGLDQPFYVQYIRYLDRLVRGDWGVTFRGAQVSTLIAGALPISMRLLAVTVLAQTVIGVTAGVVAAHRRVSFLGVLIRISSLVVIAIPIFTLAFLMQAEFGVRFRWLPAYGLTARGWSGYVLPALVLAASFTAYVARMTQIEVSETLREPYIRAARSRGIVSRRVIAVHALRPALVPVVTLIAASAGQLVSGLIIVEGVFKIPGLGGVVFEAIRSKEHALVVGILTVATLVVILASFVADVLYAIIDPRIRLQ